MAAPLHVHGPGDRLALNGIVRIGEFDSGIGAIERQTDDFSVRIERVE